ncbi:hypothetical protein L6164_025178 [Bauhinia variegata]|uniref:Uncharacterized protein n=1 Tax=Bauhinia variegata TaxID=167791 RepID=A0ACB9M168_BAUVA|nr:hypothetical protein L6164_025178 [Bauhinia variegata]
MNGSGWESGCKQHPNDKQVPGGVCSSCLREKLAQLCVDSTKPTQMDHFDTSLLSAQSKHAPSLSSSVSYRRRHHRNASDVMVDSVPRNNSSKLAGFNKSRSLAFASRSQGRDVNLNGVYGRKKNGFWSKLLKLTGKGTKVPLMHSATIIREPRA